VVRERRTGRVTPARLAPPTAGRGAAVARAVAGYRPSAARSVARPMRVTPSLRPPEPPLYPSRRDALRRWEEQEEWSCAYCDSSFGPMVAAEMDHIRPLAKGGAHEWANLAPACAACNRSKADRDVSDFLSDIAGESFTDATGATTHGNGAGRQAASRVVHNVTTSSRRKGALGDVSSDITPGEMCRPT
jgi:hypothetical protein